MKTALILLVTAAIAAGQTIVRPTQLRGVRPGTRGELVLVDGSNLFRSVRLGAGLRLVTASDGTSTLTIDQEARSMPSVVVFSKVTSQTVIVSATATRCLVFRNGLLMYEPDDYSRQVVGITTQITFTEAQPISDDVITVVYWTGPTQ